jgi:hypothetical protein
MRPASGAVPDTGRGEDRGALVGEGRADAVVAVGVADALDGLGFGFGLGFGAGFRPGAVGVALDWWPAAGPAADCTVFGSPSGRSTITRDSRSPTAATPTAETRALRRLRRGRR